MVHDLSKGQKRALREAAALAHRRDRSMTIEDRDVHYHEARNADLPLLIGAAIADGLLTEEEIGEPARALVADIAARVQAMRESFDNRPAPEPRDPYVADAPISVASIVELVDMLSDLSVIYVNRTTGEAIILGDEELSMLELGEDEDEGGDLPQWQRDSLRQTRAIRESGDWLKVAARHDFDEFLIMKKFAMRARPSVSKALLDALHGKGAFRRFRDAIHRAGIVGEWNQFRSEFLAREIQAMLDAKGVKYRR